MAKENNLFGIPVDKPAAPAVEQKTVEQPAAPAEPETPAEEPKEP